MSKLIGVADKLGNEYKRADVSDVVRAIARQVDGISDGGIAYVQNAASAAPTSSLVPYVQGDMIRNINPTVQGTVGSQYVTFAFQCVAPGSPGTWVELRALTGT